MRKVSFWEDSESLGRDQSLIHSTQVPKSLTYFATGNYKRKALTYYNDRYLLKFPKLYLTTEVFKQLTDVRTSQSLMYQGGFFCYLAWYETH